MSIYKTHQMIHFKRVILWYVNCTSGSLILTVVLSHTHPLPCPGRGGGWVSDCPTASYSFCKVPVLLGPSSLAALRTDSRRRGPCGKATSTPALRLSLLRLQSWLHSLICSLVFHEFPWKKSLQVWLPQVVWCEVKHRHLGLIFDFLMGAQVHWARSKEDTGNLEDPRPIKTDVTPERTGYAIFCIAINLLTWGMSRYRNFWCQLF